MAEPLKNVYQREFFRKLLQDFQETGTQLAETQFFGLLFDEDWDQRELKDRMRHIGQVLHQCLDRPYAKAIAAMKPVAARQANGFAYMFFPDFVEVYGLEEDWDVSMEALEHFTQYSSSEFAVRPFILREPERMMQQLYRWANHENHHVRRLASEGCRPRLPWAMALPAFKQDPAPVLPILEQLKADPSEYVRRSVANNLNDIAKDHPEQVLTIAQRWQGHSKETDWIVKHACRSMLKQGLPEALRLFGFGNPEVVRIQGLSLQQTQVRIGETLRFSFQLQQTAAEPLKLRVEFGIYYLKANGKQNRKVFMITENEYVGGKAYPFEKYQSFRNLTTRKHYPGPHRLVIIVNGVEKAECAFEVLGE